MAEYRDFIPAGEDPGAQSSQGYQDFVPAKVPVRRPEPELVTEPATQPEVATPAPAPKKASK